MAKRPVKLPPQPQQRQPESNVDRYNRLLGNRTGRPISSASDSITEASSWTGGRSGREAVARGNPDSTFNEIRSATIGRGTASRGRGSIDNSWTNNVNRLISDYTQAAAEQESLNRINQEQEQEAEEDRPWWQDITRAIGFSNPFSQDGGFQQSILGRALDLISRPAYGLAEGLNRVAGQNHLESTAGSFLSGVFSGVTGEDKTGFGQVYETYKNNEGNFGSGVLQDFEEAHPLLEQRMAQGLGFAGELFLDPLNHFIPARFRVLDESGAVANIDNMRQTVINAADNIARDTQSNLGAPALHGLPQTVAGRQINAPWTVNGQRVMDNINQSVADAYDNSVLNIGGGGSRRTRLHPRVFRETAASNAAQTLKSELSGPLVRAVEWFRNPVQKAGPFTRRRFHMAMQGNPDFDEFVRELASRMEAAQIIPPGSSLDEFYDLIILKNPNLQKSKLWDEVLGEMTARYDGEVGLFRDELAANFDNISYPTIGVRVGGKQIPMKTLGRAYRRVGRKFEGRGPFASHMFDRLSIGQRLPDRISLFSTRARSGKITGIPTLEEFNKTLRDFGRKYGEGKFHSAQDFLDRGINVVTDPEIQDIIDFIRTKQDEIFRHEVAWGVRDVTDHADDYNFLFNKGGSRADREAFKAGRKASFKDGNIRGAGEWDITKAKEMGLKPVEHSLENLFRRFEKMQRDITKQAFLKDLLDNYSFMSRVLDPDVATRLKVTRVPESDLPLAMRTAAQQAGEAVYLPKSMYTGAGRAGSTTGVNGFFEDFADMLSWSPNDGGRFTRNFSKVINQIKYLQTVPNLGFHMRNMMGDIAMGLMDDVNPADYTRIIKKYLAHKAGRNPVFNIAGRSYSWDEMVDLFHKNADSGFFQVDTGTYNSLTAGSIPKDLGRNFANNLRKASDIREEMGRFVHFVTAYTDEAEALFKKGGKSADEIARLAEDAALWRVNQYKFDYGALTPFEKQLKTTFFPFMTYVRKAAPLLLEQMFSNPQFLSMAGRFMEYNDGSGADAFNALNIPQYIKDMGFGLLTDEEEPWYMSSDMMNLGALNLLTKRNPESFFRGVLSQLNPLMAAPIELGTGRDLYFNRPLNMSWQDYVGSNIPMAGDIQSEFGLDIPGVPGNVGREAFTNPATARISGLGLPIRKISERQQEQQHNTNVDRSIEAPLRAFNNGQDMYWIDTEVNAQGTLDYVLTNRQSGVKIATAATPSEIIAIAQQQPQSDYQEPYVSPLRPPSFSDVMGRIAG